MQGIFPAIRDSGMNRTYTVLLPRPLRDGELGLKAAIELRSRQFFSGARGNQILQSEIDTDFASR
jgi:hypothetical protein